MFLSWMIVKEYSACKTEYAVFHIYVYEHIFVYEDNIQLWKKISIVTLNFPFYKTYKWNNCGQIFTFIYRGWSPLFEGFSV